MAGAETKYKTETEAKTEAEMFISFVHERSSRVVGRTIKWTGVGSRTELESSGKEGDTPVSETDNGCECVPEYHGTRETLWESGGTTLQG